MNNLVTALNSGQLFSVWYTSRAAGLTAYLLLFLSMVSGILLSFHFIKGARSRQLMNVLHSSTGWFGLLFGMVHGFVLLFDQYVGYHWTEIVIPFASDNQPILTGLGTLSLYILLLLVVSSDLIRQMGKKAWRSIHYLAFPGYVGALCHGILQGTDTQYNSITIMYIATGAIMAGLVVLRIMLAKKGNPQPSALNSQL